MNIILLNNYTAIYWLTRLDAIKVMFGICLGLSLVYFVVSLFNWDMIKTNKIEGWNVKAKQWKRHINKSIVLLFFSLVLCVFTPSKKDVLMIYAGGKTLDFVQSDTSLNKIPAQTTKIITDYLQKQIEENGRNK